MGRFKQYLVNVFVGFDQMVNAVLGGDPDMTLSGRMGRAIAQGHCRLCKPVCRLLDRIDPGHCAKAAKAERDEGRHQVTGV